MNRLYLCVPIASLLLASSAYATEPSLAPPLEERLAQMNVIVAGVLKVEGEGPGRSVTLEVSQVLKWPDDLKAIKPGAVLAVTPRPVGFSDQGGDGVWSLELKKADGEHVVAKYEFITYGRESEHIKNVLGMLGRRNYLTQKAALRARETKGDLEAFQMQLLYHGPQNKPYYQLTLSCLPIPQLASTAFHPLVQIDQHQAKRIINHLAGEGFFDQATEFTTDAKKTSAAGYSLLVSGNDKQWHAELGWSLAMLQRLDDLRLVLANKAAEGMDRLLQRLSGHRSVWVAEATE